MGKINDPYSSTRSYIFYKAPEIYSIQRQYFKTDVWNLGLVVFVMFSGYFFEEYRNEPGNCQETMIQSFMKVNLKDVDNVFINFVLSCTAFDLNKRWDSKTALMNALKIKMPKIKTISFSPGYQGISWIDNRVVEVDSGSQGEQLGVQCGWHGVAINGQGIRNQDIVDIIMKIKDEKPEEEMLISFQGSDANVLVLKKDLEKLEMMKKNAIIKEDYDSAKSLIKQIEKKKEELRIAAQKTTSQMPKIKTISFSPGYQGISWIDNRV